MLLESIRGYRKLNINIGAIRVIVKLRLVIL